MRKLIVVFILQLYGCAYVAYSGQGENTKATLFEIGRTEAIAGFKADNHNGGREVSLGSAQTDVNVNALQTGNAAIGAIVGEALKVYTAKP